METAIAPCIELTKWVGSPMIRRIKYLKELKHNMDILTQKKNELVAKESDITTKLQRAKEQRKQEPLEEVTLWLKRVEEVKTEVSNIERSLQEIRPHNCFSKFHSRIKLAKLVVQEIKELDELRGKEFPEGVVGDAPAETAILFEPASVRGQSTAEKTMDEIMELLLNHPEVGKIGVHGMGGIGKTTIMKNINNKLAEMTHFNRIIWVTVSKEVGGIREIQHKIAQELSQELSDKLSRWDDEGRRAAALLGELKRIGKFLIILDDLWKQITLQDVGIPQPNKDNNCKVLVTTRLLPVCDFIETQKNVEVKCLSDEEAWNLFVSKVGDHILANNNPEIEAVAKQVVDECGGLPLAIVTIGCALSRRQKTWQWERALNELRGSTIATSITDHGMKDKVFKLLRFSYVNLKSQVFQKCFLYCAFFPEDHKISSKQLVELWVAEGYMEEAGIDDQYDNWDMKAEMNRGFQILVELKDACMLESNQIEECVKMHDLVRNLAINIMREDFGFLAKAGLQLEELPKEAWERANKISLIWNKMVNFPNQLNCPTLSTLLLQANKSAPFVFPPCFFSRMPALRVLDLFSCNCKELPASLSNLVSLRYLNLCCSKIKELPQGLGALLNLRYLDLSYSKIKELPEGLGALLNLRYLNLSYTEIRELPQGLGALLNLRYLNLGYSKIKELPEGLGALLNLRYLNLSYTAIRELPQEMGALVRLRFLGLIGTPLHNIHVNVLSKLTLLEDLRLSLHSLKSPKAAAIIQEMTYLKCFANLSISISDYGDYLVVMKHVPWDSVKSFNIQLVGRDGPIYVGYDFANVVHIEKIDICNELSSFCLPNNTERLSLRDFKIPPLSEFQCLKNLRLLKKLDLEKNLVSENFLVRGEEMEPNALASLEHLRLRSMDGCKSFVEGKLPDGCLANLKVLDVTSCNCFKSLFSFQILSHFNNIENIKVAFCNEIEEIVGHGDGDNNWEKDMGVTTAKNIIILPKLRELKLWNLRKLKSISRETTWVCDSLTELDVVGCPEIEARLPFKKSLFAKKCYIYGDTNWWEALQCDDAETKALFHYSGPLE